MADKNQRAQARAILNAAALLQDSTEDTSGKDGVITISARPPRIEVKPRMDLGIASVPPSETVLDRWQAGIRAAGNTGDVNIIQMYDIIGYDYWDGGGITAKSVSDQLRAFNGEDVEVHINSPGGDMFEGIAIYNVLQQYRGNVTVKIMGLAASAASIIAMAGNEVEIGQGAFLMIHNCWVVAIGNKTDMAEVAAYLAPFDEAMAGIYVARTGQKMADVQRWMDEETWFSAEKSLELGFADSKLDDSELTEDKSTTEKAKALNTVRKVENVLTKQGGMSRTAARSLIQELKGSKPDAAANETGDKPGAVITAKPGAGQDWLDKLRALNASFKS